MNLKIVDGFGSIKAEAQGEEVVLVFQQEYVDGDSIILEHLEENYYVIQLDDSLGESLVYIDGSCMEFPVPFAEKKVCYSPKSFSGEVHVLKARKALESESNCYRNLALNIYDCHESACCFPHATANVETRGESIFAAKNAINGNKANESHGPWPYESWGINRNPEATMKIEFGRTVCIDKVVLYTRADYPHDSYWIQGTLRFSDGSTEVVELHKTEKAQIFPIQKRKVEWVQLEQLIKAEDESPFPALSQIEIFGK